MHLTSMEKSHNNRLSIQGASLAIDHLDEALLSSLDGYILFNRDDQLVAWSENYFDLYPKLSSVVKVGFSYRDILRAIIEQNAVKNCPARESIKDFDTWLDKNAQRSLGGDYVHHLRDDRKILIKHAPVSDGGNLYLALDITSAMDDMKSARIPVEKFQQFAELASDWFWELNENLEYHYHSTHRARVSDELESIERLTSQKWGGVSRLDDLANSNALKDEQFNEHQRALQAHETVDVVLTFVSDDYEKNYVRIKAEPRFDDEGVFVGYMGCGHDRSVTYRLQHSLEYQSNHDELTDLFNRRAITRKISDIIDRFSEQDVSLDRTYTLTLFDVDHFKSINDEAGHHVGDLLLVEIAKTIREFDLPESTIARMGGDEFAILMAGDLSACLPRLTALTNELCRTEIEYEHRKYKISISAGITTLDREIVSPDQLFQFADVACYSSKITGRGNIQAYSPMNIFQARQRAEISHLPLIKKSIASGNVALFLQPIQSSDCSRNLSKFEVLMRFYGDDGEIISPGEMIPVAEKYELMPDIDLIVIEKSVQWCNKFSECGLDIDMSVNLSGTTLGSKKYLRKVRELLSQTKNPSRLCIEITETTAINSIDTAREFIEHCRMNGHQFSLDDFGSGLSSFAYLKDIPADYLKIDGCFVKDILEDVSCQAIVKSFATLAHEMNMYTVAEFVETQEIADYLRTLGIDYFQGYGIGKPAPIEQWFELLTTSSVQHKTGS